MAGPLKDTKKMKYEEEFMKHGFTSVVINGKERPQCVKCCEVLANESFKVNKLIRHLKTKHDSLADRGTEFFKIKAEIVKKTRLDSSGSYQQKNDAAVEVSYLVAQRSAKVKTPQTGEEELILPCAKDIVSVVMGSDYLIRLQPLSLPMTQLGEELKIWHMIFCHK
jgi:hypothetical protein